MSQSTSFAIGVDIGGTKIDFALISSTGDLITSNQIETDAPRGSKVVFSEIIHQINFLTTQSPLRPLGVGIGCPGHVFPQTGFMYGAVNLGWDDIDFVKEIRGRLKQDLPIYIRKDTDACLIGEIQFGAAQGFSNVAYLSLGSGLGGALWVNNRLVNGASYSAGALGHIPLFTHGRICTCGRLGCTETFLSGPGLVAEAYQILAQSEQQPSILRSVDVLTPQLIIKSAREQDPLTMQIISSFMEGLGWIFSICVSMLNPQLIIIGGGLGLEIFDIIQVEAVKYMKAHTLVKNCQDVLIKPSGLRTSAIGAASLVWYED